MLDVERAFDTSLPVEDYLELIVRKTADLFRLCCYIGAAEASLTEDDVAAVAEFGTEIGIAFQVLDDCLDIDAGDPGKPAGTDHLLGLFGAPTLFALRGDTSGALRELLLNPGLGVADLPEIGAMVRESGGLAEARQLARERYDSAFAALDRLPDQLGRAAVRDAVEPVWRRLR
jgi:geranylgeranyl pyrophosphate synthase